MGWMPVNPQVRAAMDLPNYEADADRERKIQLAQEGQTSQEVQGEQERGTKSSIAKLQAESAENVARIQAAAQVAAANARARGGGYAAGGTVKNDHPFNKSFDNKLLMKGRR